MINLRISRIYLKIFIFCIVSCAITTVLLVFIFQASINRLVEYYDSVSRKGRLSFHKQDLIVNIIPTATTNGILNIDALNRYLINQICANHVKALWLVDENRNVIAGVQSPPIEPQSRPKSKIRWFEIFAESSLQQKFDKIVHMPIDLPGYKNCKLFMRTSSKGPALFLQAARIMLLISFWGIMFTGILIYIPVTLFVIKPTRKLQNVVRSIAEGNLKKRISVKGQDALQHLAININKMADRIERLVTSTQALSTHISHEIRTPLTQIKIALDIHRKALSLNQIENINEKLDSIDEDVNKIDRLVGHILAFAKQDLTELHEKQENICAKEIILKIINGLSTEINYKCLKILTDIKAGNTSVLATSENIYLLFSNVISNAIKFCPKRGTVQITILSKNESHIIFRIANTCLRLSKNDMDHYFEPFYKGSNHNLEGTGLGLAIVQKIVKKYNGTITVDKWNGDDGIVFEINLPVTKALFTTPPVFS